MVWNIGPVNEYEAQNAIITFVGALQFGNLWYRLLTRLEFGFVSYNPVLPLYVDNIACL
jgi:hypothetical protein